MQYTTNTIRTFILIGSILAIIGYIMDLIDLFSNHHSSTALIGTIVGIIISVLIFIMLGVFHTRKFNIPFNEVVMLVFVVIQIVISGAALLSLVGIGIILEIIGTVLLFMGR